VSAKQAAFLSLASALAFCVVAALVYGSDRVQRHDARLLVRLYARRETAFGDIAAAVVHLGDPAAQAVLVGGLIAVAIGLGRRREAIGAAVLVLGANLTTQVLKGVLSQPRYQPLLGYEQVSADAFPSGHATAMAAMTYACLLVLPRRWWPVAAISASLAVLVGASSVVLHKHYSSDVVGGVLLATAWFWGVLAVLRYRQK